jgi:hypothetical protein
MLNGKMKIKPLIFILPGFFLICGLIPRENTKSFTPPAQEIQSVDTTGIVTDSYGYAYIPPESWTLEKGNGYILYTQVLADGRPGCRLIIIPPVVSSGKLEDDVKSIFLQMYPGWRYYYSDARHDDLVRGNTKQGAPYYMLEAEMVKDRPDGGRDYEQGAALVVGSGKQSAIIALRHEITGLNCQCKQRYNTWQRFFNSFAIKNLSPQSQRDTSPSRFIGSWMSSGNRSISEYIFAANGRFQFIGGFGSYSKISNEILELKTSAWQGDGSYSIQGDRLLFTRKGETKPDIYRFRFESINKGSTGWKERICLLNEHPRDNGPAYEACYEKTERK